MYTVLSNRFDTVVFIISIFTLLFCPQGALSEQVGLRWDANSDSNLAGYVLYIGEESNSYSTRLDLAIRTSYTAQNLEAGKTYYFSLAAYDTQENESPKAQEISRTIVAAIPRGDTPTNQDTDSDGITDIDEIAIGTNPYKADSDGDGVSDSDEISNDTDPLDRGSSLDALKNSQCVGWNGFFAMWNILEISNRHTEALDVKISFFSPNGASAEESIVNVSAGQKKDILIHDLQNRQVNHYGNVCLSYEGPAGLVDGGIVYYLSNSKTEAPSSTRARKAFQFAFSMPFENGKIGRQYIPFNTFQPSLHLPDSDNLVANWIQLSNLGQSAVSGSLVIYGQDGSLLGRERIGIQAGQRQDTGVHRFGKNLVGFVEWIPDEDFDMAPIRIESVRYIYDNQGQENSFDTAFQLSGLYASGRPQALPLDTTDGSAVVEVSNVTPTSVSSVVSFYDENGNLAGAVNLELPAHSTKHLIADEILGSGKRGLAIVSSTSKSSLVAIAMHYGRWSDGGVKYMYGVPGKEALGHVLRGNYNTYLGHQSKLRLVNPTSSAQTVSLRIVRFDGTPVREGWQVVVPPTGSRVLSINDIEVENVYGSVDVQPLVGNSVVAWITRERPNDYVVLTPVRQ